MKLPKQIPVKLLYVLLVIFLWSSIMDKSSDDKEDFDMKDVKNILMDKLMGKKDDKEDFDMKDVKNILMDKLMGKKDDKEDFDMKQMKDVKNMLMDKLMGKKDDKEDFEPFDKEEEKQSVTPWSTLHGSPIQK
jgi:hypothetical protein